jgi:hypothetical protein
LARGKAQNSAESQNFKLFYGEVVLPLPQGEGEGEGGERGKEVPRGGNE